jgi:hypothetical protein
MLRNIDKIPFLYVILFDMTPSIYNDKSRLIIARDNLSDVTTLCNHETVEQIFFQFNPEKSCL